MSEQIYLGAKIKTQPNISFTIIAYAKDKQIFNDEGKMLGTIEEIYSATTHDLQEKSFVGYKVHSMVKDLELYI